MSEASERGAQLLVLPEMFMGLATSEQPLLELAHRHAETFLAGLGELAAEAQIHITAGCWEPIPSSRRVYNTVYTLGPDGSTLAAYRKIHLFDALGKRESDTMRAGSELPPVVSIRGVQVGFAICYDLRFPELFRSLALRGADLIVVPSAWYRGPTKKLHWRTLLRARAIENTVYVAGCGLAGELFCGVSAIYDPFGVSVREAGEAPCVLVGCVNTARLEQVRGRLPSLHNRRFELDDLRLRRQ